MSGDFRLYLYATAAVLCTALQTFAQTSDSVSMATPVEPPLCLLADSIPDDALIAAQFPTNANPDTTSLSFQCTASGIILTLPDSIACSSSDVATAWNSFARRHPASAIFRLRGITGVEGFLAGTETTISGLSPLSSRTIKITPLRGDSLLCSDTARLRAILTQAPPTIKPIKSTEWECSKPATVHPALRCTAPQKNPVVALSLGLCSSAVLRDKDDIALLSRPKMSAFIAETLFTTRCFLAFSPQADTIRQQKLISLVHPDDLLKKSIRVIGSPITALYDSLQSTHTDSSIRPAQILRTGNSVSLMYPREYPLLQSAALKIAASWATAGCAVTTQALPTAEFEKRVLRREYDVAISSIPFVNNLPLIPWEELAATYFNSAPDEVSCRNAGLLVPLFSVVHFLCKKKPPAPPPLLAQEPITPPLDTIPAALPDSMSTSPGLPAQ